MICMWRTLCDTTIPHRISSEQTFYIQTPYSWSDISPGNIHNLTTSLLKNLQLWELRIIFKNISFCFRNTRVLKKEVNNSKTKTTESRKTIKTNKSQMLDSVYSTGWLSRLLKVYNFCPIPLSSNRNSRSSSSWRIMAPGGPGGPAGPGGPGMPN